MFKGGDRYVVLAVTLELEPAAAARPIAYPQLTAALGVGPGDRPPLAVVREAVLGLRRAKGMVVDPADPDSVSVGSFFTNPILDHEGFRALKGRASDRLDGDDKPPGWPQPNGAVKTSAAWLIERAGFERGYGAARSGSGPSTRSRWSTAESRSEPALRPASRRNGRAAEHSAGVV